MFSQFGKKLPELLSATSQVNFIYFTPFGDYPSLALAFLGDASFSRVVLKALNNGEVTTSQKRIYWAAKKTCSIRTSVHDPRGIVFLW